MIVKTRLSKNRLKMQKQSGAALAICLIILLIMTIIGVNSMSGLVLEERMANNSRQYVIAAEQAEAALRTGENWISTDVTKPSDIALFNGSNGLYSRVAPASLPFDVFDSGQWAANGFPVTTLASIDPRGVKEAGSLVGQNPAYIVEYFGRASAPDVTGKISGKKLDPTDTNQSQKFHVFRITAVGWGEDGTTRFLVQSTVRKCLVGSKCQ